MDKMAEIAQTKVETLTSAVSSDPRWQIEDELMCQVFGYTMFGYAFAVGRIQEFMDVPDIQQLACNQLVGLGIGGNYAEGLTADAYDQFAQEGNTSLNNQFISIGHSHLGSDDVAELADSVFKNTELLRQSM